MRKTAEVRIEGDSRDTGKIFVITEMAAAQGEAWAARIFLGLMASGQQVPFGLAEMGMAGLAEMGFRGLSGIKWELAEPLLNEMMQCVQIRVKADTIRPLLENEPGQINADIEEISTRVKLRYEWFKLHLGFSLAAVKLFQEKLQAVMTAMKSNTAQTSPE